MGIGFRVFCGLCWVVSPVALAASREAVDLARTTTSEWIAAEGTLSRERWAWEEERVLLDDLIGVRRIRAEKLEAAIAEAEAAVSTTDAVRLDLLAKREALDAEAARIEAFAEGIEAWLRELRVRLPDPLREELAALYRRLPDEETKVELGERMRTVISLLSEIRRFDGRLTVSERIAASPGGGGGETVIRTLWIGLGQAYYLTPADAGVGIPGAAGWEWRSQPELAERIREAIGIAESGAAAPKWIDLPVVLREGSAE